MTAIVNGEERELAAGTTVSALLDALGLRGKRYAVEVNRDVVPRTSYAERLLAEGDHVEIVQFVGGG
jgi:sulfur carrier protein